jgi:hypothetical protein
MLNQLFSHLSCEVIPPESLATENFLEKRKGRLAPKL